LKSDLDFLLVAEIDGRPTDRSAAFVSFELCVLAKRYWNFPVPEALRNLKIVRS